LKLLVAGEEFEVQPGSDTVTVGETSYSIRTIRRGGILTVYVNEKPFAVQLPEDPPEEGSFKLLVDAKEYEVEAKGKTGAVRARPKAAAKKGAGGAAGAITAQMTGRVIRVDAKPGDAVKEGDVLLIIEAMKMENEITAPMAGTVKEVSVAAGARVSEGDLLVQIEPAP
jgi:biotin carboxyl carrier protein